MLHKFYQYLQRLKCNIDFDDWKMMITFYLHKITGVIFRNFILTCQSTFVDGDASYAMPYEPCDLDFGPFWLLRLRSRGGRGSAAIPDVEVRPEIEFRQEPEIDNPAEIQITMSAICEGGSGTTSLEISETVSISM